VTDYTDLIVYLRAINDRYCDEAADALEAQARRIADLRKEADMMHSEYKTARDRIAELKAALLRIGQPGKKVIYCRDGHEEAVLLARAAYRGEKE